MSEDSEVKPKLDRNGEPLNDIERAIVVLLQIRDLLWELTGKQRSD